MKAIEWPLDGMIIATLPEGTYRVRVEAFWHIAGPDGKFRGGTYTSECSLGGKENDSQVYGDKATRSAR